jgi:hypothetical protein
MHIKKHQSSKNESANPYLSSGKCISKHAEPRAVLNFSLFDAHEHNVGCCLRRVHRTEAKDSPERVSLVLSLAATFLQSKWFEVRYRSHKQKQTAS